MYFVAKNEVGHSENLQRYCVSVYVGILDDQMLLNYDISAMFGCIAIAVHDSQSKQIRSENEHLMNEAVLNRITSGAIIFAGSIDILL